MPVPFGENFVNRITMGLGLCALLAGSAVVAQGKPSEADTKPAEEAKLPDGEAVAAIGISVPNVNLPDNGEERFGSLSAHAAEAISRKLSRV